MPHPKNAARRAEPSAAKITWAVVQPADDFDNPSVCAFEGDPAHGIMADVICEVTSIDEEEDRRRS